jgi:DNA gyrase subunit A
MATNIPPHNLSEIADAIVFVIDNWAPQRDRAGRTDALRQGAGLPHRRHHPRHRRHQAGLATGRGKVIVRAQTSIEETRGGRFAIIVTEIPYQVNKSTLIERMAELVREGRLDMISDIRDESDRTGMRIVIELKRNAAPKKARNRLFKHTQLQAPLASTRWRWSAASR